MLFIWGHEDKKFKVKEFCVTRENMLVSPYYFKSGGTVIDWWPKDGDKAKIKINLSLFY